MADASTATSNPEAIVTGLADMLRRMIGEDVTLITRLEPAAGDVPIERARFEQLVMNLVLNARDAMPDGGKLTLEVANAYLDDAYASQHADVNPGQYVMLAVSDTGTGMSEEIMARVFEPFFTTKQPGRGTGLGLSTVYGFAKQSRGAVVIDSAPGAGTTLSMYLPRPWADVGSAGESAPATPALPPGVRVLMVEDDAEVRAVALHFASHRRAG